MRNRRAIARLVPEPAEQTALQVLGDLYRTLDEATRNALAKAVARGRKLAGTVGELRDPCGHPAVARLCVAGEHCGDPVRNRTDAGSRAKAESHFCGSLEKRRTCSAVWRPASRLRDGEWSFAPKICGWRHRLSSGGSGSSHSTERLPGCSRLESRRAPVGLIDIPIIPGERRVAVRHARVACAPRISVDFSGRQWLKNSIPRSPRFSP